MLDYKYQEIIHCLGEIDKCDKQMVSQLTELINHGQLVEGRAYLASKLTENGFRIEGDVLSIYLRGYYNGSRAPGGKKQAAQAPPRGAKYLLYCCPRKYRENLIGDLEEEYSAVVAEFGPRKAWIFYWSQVIGSVAPILCRLVVGSSLVTAAAGAVSWLWQRLGQ